MGWINYTMTISTHFNAIFGMNERIKVMTTFQLFSIKEEKIFVVHPFKTTPPPPPPPPFWPTQPFISKMFNPLKGKEKKCTLCIVYRVYTNFTSTNSGNYSMNVYHKFRISGIDLHNEFYVFILNNRTLPVLFANRFRSNKNIK